MKKVFLVLIINCILFGSSYASQDVFSVILSKGNNSYGADGKFSPVLLGTSIGDKDVLKVAQGGYIALVHESTGASLELSEMGEYTVDEMEKDMMKQSSTVLEKYGKFLMSRLNPDNLPNQNLNVTGAVERGDLGLIQVNLPKVNDVYGNQAYISWKQVDDVETYVISIKDKLDDVIFEKSVQGTNYILNLDDGPLAEEQIIIVNVQAQGNEDLRSRDFGLKRLSEEDSQSINVELSNLEKVANSNNALDKLLIASFFEENQLLADAITYYNLAIKISPDPQSFNVLYDNFLARNGLK